MMNDELISDCELHVSSYSSLLPTDYTCSIGTYMYNVYEYIMRRRGMLHLDTQGVSDLK